MSYNKSIKKNLFILGNGFDLALNLRSGFSNYIEDQKSGKEYVNVLNFIKTFHKCELKLKLLLHPFLLHRLSQLSKPFMPKSLRTKYLSNNNFGIINNFNKLLTIVHKMVPYILKASNSTYKEYIHNVKKINNNFPYKEYSNIYYQRYMWINDMLHRYDNDGTSDFYNIKLLLFENSINYYLSKVNSSEDTKIHNKIEQLSDKWLKELINSANNIKGINLWDLIIIFQKIYSNNKYDNSQYNFNNWCDVEDTIKYFITSIYDIPKYKNNHVEFYNLDYYFTGANSFFRNCFNSYVYINVYIRLLNKISESTNFFLSNNKMYSNDLYRHAVSNMNKHVRYIAKPRLFDRRNENSFYINIPYLKDPLNSKSLIFLLQYFWNDKFEQEDTNIKSFLMIQLNQFEESFSKYLKQPNVIPYKTIRNYEKASSNLLTDISDSITKRLMSDRGDSVKEQALNDFDNKYEVIDFNYTPLSNHIQPQEHIHGSLNSNNIIIGIDDTEVNNLLIRLKNNSIRKEITDKITDNSKTINYGNYSNRDVVRTVSQLKSFNNSRYANLLDFTKTYRILGMNEKDDNYSFENKSFDGIDNIIFFGHSLDINDYPYFEAIFDRVHLYNSNTRLVFCYNKHSNEKKSAQQCKKEQISNIVNLLRRYGRTMNNRAHGANLISKMLIENRIRFFDATKCVNKVLPKRRNNSK